MPAFPCPTANEPNSLTIGTLEESSLYAIPRIPIDCSPPTSILPLFNTVLPFTA